MRFRTFFTLLLLTSYFLLPTSTHAQLTPEDALLELTQTISISIRPENPGPNSPVSISINSSATDLDNSQISWSVDGKVEKSGQGVKSFSLRTGNLGTSVTVDINIRPAVGESFRKTVVIKPSEIDLMWQGNTYTPPFYKGRALWSTQSRMTIFAVPHVTDSSGREINRSSLIYKWSRNDTVLGSLSGANKHSLTLSSSIFPAPQKIRVDVSTNGETLASKTIIISPTSPQILVYENNPLYGPLFNAEVGQRINLREKEITFVAYPLFFGVSDRNDASIKYSWSANGSNVGQNTSRVTFRSPDSAGSSNLSIHAENSAKFTQTADKSFGVEFSNENNF